MWNRVCTAALSGCIQDKVTKFPQTVSTWNCRRLCLVNQHSKVAHIHGSSGNVKDLSAKTIKSSSAARVGDDKSNDSKIESRMKWRPKNMCGVSFQVEDKVGALLNVLRIIEKHNLSMTRIENRPQPLSLARQTVTIHFEGDANSPDVEKLVADISTEVQGNVVRVKIPDVPWFPRTLSDIDNFSQQTLDAGTEINSDHPGFHDAEYRARRNHIVSMACEYKSGQPIATVEYSASELECWRIVYSKLSELFPEHCCEEYTAAVRDLEARGIYGAHRIPQLQEVSEYLQGKTGFRLRPVAGLLSGRDFLNALALRVFFSTQYIRHPSVPVYTPEPDIIHELLGHAPMLANQDFADFSQIIGLASLGATDDQIKMLATCYWFSVEFGLLFQDNNLRAYGAGLLSSAGELQYATSPTNSKVEIRAWDPFSAAVQEYPITTYQPVYYAAKSLGQAKETMMGYCQQLSKPFFIRFDSSSHTVVTDMNVHTKPVSLRF
eukprot:GHVQ01023479.1.p1 GENE.GHVQ01023479.1~~GHVQ01023479.1.p1  ORF type:complete len:492 (-),score=33.57 GHVQ01023479.1:677-2152(-)